MGFPSTEDPWVHEVIAEEMKRNNRVKERYYKNAVYYNNTNSFIGAVCIANDSLLKESSTFRKEAIAVLIRGYFREPEHELIFSTEVNNG